GPGGATMGGKPVGNGGDLGAGSSERAGTSMPSVVASAGPIDPSPKNVDGAGASGGSARSREANHSLASFTGYFSLRTRRNSRRSRVALDRRSSGQLRRSARRVVSLTTCGESQFAS